ncbi:MAG TPA: hypothetical protein DIW30_07280 [Bacteroidales bacterium]|nr:hypothetical protein [Bacteroidales bacterium]
MKKHIYILTFLLLAWGNCLPLFAAAGTEGKEFWVALTIGRAPQDKGSDSEFYICVSSKNRQGEVTVSNPISGWQKTYLIPPGTGWLEIKDIPENVIYPFGDGVTKQWAQASGNRYNTGLRVSCTENMSVFAAMRYTYAFDATNVLPTTALQSDYIIQEYPPYGNDGTAFSNFCVLATEDNTEVEITPYNTTYCRKAGGTPFTVTLNKGEVYYLCSQEGTEDNASAVSLSGSKVHAKGGKKIAVFNGDVCTRTPNNVSARDINYEQAIPTDYWGREFVVTRSKEKDANRFRITAMEDGTVVSIDGSQVATLAACETFEFELAITKQMNKTTLPASYCFVEDAAYVSTSCPVALYNYDTGNSYKSKDKNVLSEFVGEKGDPSMTWVSPLEQKISEITFGVMNTDKTTKHFVNIVTETANTGNVELREVRAGQFGFNMVSPSDFVSVTGLPGYSYARVPLTENQNTIYTLKGDGGFIAHVYGNGDDESYAYSVGSAAVRRGIEIGNQIWQDGVTSDVTYCIGEPIHLNAQVGSDIIDYADWDMGDGSTKKGSMNATNIAFDYTYESPGWYDITATVYAHKDCPYSQYPPEDVNIAIHVVRPDTIKRNFFICEGDTFKYGGQEYTQPQKDTIHFDCDSVVIFNLEVGLKTDSTLQLTARDSCYWNGTMYYQSGKYEWKGTNAAGCDSTVYLDLHILTCLELASSNEIYTFCGDDESISLPYAYIKGDIGTAQLRFGDKTVPLNEDNGSFVADMQYFHPAHYSATIEVEDTICQQTIELPVTFDIMYPSAIIRQKWANVLALYNAEKNGGYTFSSYQWYKNGEPIEGATGSYYHSDEPFNSTDEYSVLLSREGAENLFTCPLTASAVEEKSLIRIQPTLVTVGESISISTNCDAEAVLYNSLGVRQQAIRCEGYNEIAAPQRTGVYMLNIVLKTGEQKTIQIIVQ